MKKQMVAILMLGVLLLAGGLVQAALVTIQISGNVTSASGSALPATIIAGTTSFTGTYTYDSSAIDSNPTNDKFGEYRYNAPYGINVSLGGYEFKTAPAHTEKFSVLLDMYYGNRYYYTVKSSQNITFPGDIAVEEIRWTLGDSTRTVPTSDALPVTEPILAEWDYNVFSISGPNLLIQGTVEEAVLIPEPLTVALMAIGTVFLRRRR